MNGSHNFYKDGESFMTLEDNGIISAVDTEPSAWHIVVNTSNAIETSYEQLGRVNADGSCELNWDLIEKTAAKWQPYGDVWSAFAKLLLAARDGT